MYPLHPQSYDKYGGTIPVAVPPLGIPTSPRQTQFKPSLHARSRDGSATWSTGLCHCCDDPANCVITCLCPCITFGQIAEIVDKGSSSCAGRGGGYGLLLGLTGFACLYSCIYRSKIRGQYDLEEAPFADCLVHFCCETCALCQEYRELKNRGFDMSIGWQANVDRQSRGIQIAPIRHGGMIR